MLHPRPCHPLAQIQPAEDQRQGGGHQGGPTKGQLAAGDLTGRSSLWAAAAAADLGLLDGRWRTAVVRGSGNLSLPGEE